MSEEAENLIKSTCRALGITYRELGERIGYGEDAIKKAALSPEVSKPMQKAIELMVNNIKLKEEITQQNQLKALLKDFIG